MFKLSAQMFPGVKGSRLGMASQRIKMAIPQSLTRIAIDAEKQVKTDYLQRGGTFTRKKADGWRWIKNPGKWLRVGTGNLRRSWLHVAAVKVFGGWQAQIISRGVPYGRIHEEGGMAGRGKTTRIPKRSYIAPMFKDNDRKWHDWLGTDVMAIFK